jgi:hypothetical protein
MPFGLLEIAVQMLLAVHAVRTGRMQPWLWIILFIPGLGSLIYILVGDLARQVEIAPTVHNKLRLAEECLRLGRAQEAAGLYATCAVGLHANGARRGRRSITAMPMVLSVVAVSSMRSA